MIMQLLVLLLWLCTFSTAAQPSVYTTSNAHSHNDYEQATPFWEAYQYGFGSIEADIFLVKGSRELLVAHTPGELIRKRRRLDSLYLIPVVECIRKNAGTPYRDKSKKLQLLIDIKTTAVPTLHKLIETIKRYPELTNTAAVTFVISGNRPPADSFFVYPAYILFDGELNKTYSTKALTKIALMSDDLRRYTLWNGKDSLSEGDRIKLQSEIAKSHALKKPVRFWDAPDNGEAWNVLMHLGLDYINTDKIAALARFLEKTKVQTL